MLKFLTHKLRTHSLNEDQPHQDKADDDHDSGTESDDENGDADDPESNSEQPCISPVVGQLLPLQTASAERSQGAETVTEHPRKLSMESEAERSRGCAVSPFPLAVGAAGPSAGVAALTACSPYFLDSALPSDSDHTYDHDHHSSEEELEVINSCPAAVAPASSDSPPEAASSGCRLPGGGGGGGGGGGCGGGARPASGAGALLVTVRSGSVTVPEKRKWSQVTHQAAPHVLLAADCAPGGVGGGGGGGSSSSSDDEVQGLLAAMSTPVRFRTWPPTPRRARGTATRRAPRTSRGPASTSRRCSS